ncbi:hypothetical protein HMPREF0645_1686 [Hallella bergensis DSM 17361]|uniref:Uncharacterized protein n=1 Tax=Hallella bergensis DSM 17361 TaxID=585502 RepID=D1PXK1_9BACT|nr:hypothetical protein HMPREF0645_1686 [Hallella bergensis DSM 17361]
MYQNGVVALMKAWHFQSGISLVVDRIGIDVTASNGWFVGLLRLENVVVVTTGKAKWEDTQRKKVFKFHLNDIKS